MVGTDGIIRMALLSAEFVRRLIRQVLQLVLAVGRNLKGIGIQLPFRDRLSAIASADQDLPWLGLFAERHLEGKDSIPQSREGLRPVETGG